MGAMVRARGRSLAPRGILPAMPHALIRLALVTAALVLAAPANPPQSVPLHAPVRVCAGGDVTLGTNLDPSWARRAADSLRTTWGLSS